VRIHRSDDTSPVTCLLAGTARGVVLKLMEPLNAWGGLDADSSGARESLSAQSAQRWGAVQSDAHGLDD